MLQRNMECKTLARQFAQAIGACMNQSLPTRSGSAARAEKYRQVAGEIDAVLDAEPDRVARMATVAAMLADAFEHFFWTGFYLVDPGRREELVVGPYQGTLGCLEHIARRVLAARDSPRYAEARCEPTVAGDGCGGEIAARVGLSLSTGPGQ